MRQVDECTQGFNMNLQRHFSVGQPQFCNEEFTEDFSRESLKFPCSTNTYRKSNSLALSV